MPRIHKLSIVLHIFDYRKFEQFLRPLFKPLFQTTTLQTPYFQTTFLQTTTLQILHLSLPKTAIFAVQNVKTRIVTKLYLHQEMKLKQIQSQQCVPLTQTYSHLRRHYRDTLRRNVLLQHAPIQSPNSRTQKTKAGNGSIELIAVFTWIISNVHFFVNLLVGISDHARRNFFTPKSVHFNRFHKFHCSNYSFNRVHQFKYFENKIDIISSVWNF